MTNYDPHDWTSHLFDVEGSLVHEIIGRVTACMVWATVVTLLEVYGPTWFRHLTFPETAHALIGASLGLLLVFRTNSSYDRFWEGRKLWGAIVNTTRNLGRQTSIWLAKDHAIANETIRWTIAFPYATMKRLRGKSDLGPVERDLPAAKTAAVLKSGHVPLATLRQLTELVLESRSRELIDSHQLQSMDQNLQLLADHCGGCERIRSTPMPFAYTVHLRRALIVYCVTLPLALVEKFGLVTIPVTLVIAYVLFGIEEIGVEIEDPFGDDVNDLPLEQICQGIEQNLREMELS